MGDIEGLLMRLGSVAALLILLALVGWVFDSIRRSGSKKSIHAENERYRALYDEQDRARAQFQASIRSRTLSLLDALQIENRDSTPLLHKPVYDCATDRFEVPCAHDLIEHPLNPESGGSIGRMTSRDVVQRKLESMLTIVPCADYEYVAVVGDDRFLAIISDAGEGGPGGSVLRLVRTGASEWYSYYWKAGCRPSASAIDPPFRVKDLVRNPDLWHQREQVVKAACLPNPHYQSALRQCRHRNS